MIKMKYRFKVSGIYFLIAVIVGLVSCKPRMPQPPLAKKTGIALTGKGDLKGDPYLWMEDKNDSALQIYILLENEYAEKYSGLHGELLKKLSLEMAMRADPLLISDALPRKKNTKEVQTGDGKFKLSVNDRRQVIAHFEKNGKEEHQPVYEETTPGFGVYVGLSKSQRYFFIISNDGHSSETRVLPADLSNLKPFLIQPWEKGIRYTVEHFGSDIFWILTNNNAPNRKLMQAMVSHPEEKFWISVAPNRDSIYLEDFSLLDERYLVLLERQNPGVGIRLYDRDHNDEGAIYFKEPDGALQVSDYDPERGKILLRYTSLLSPVTIYEYDIKTGRLGIRKKTGIKNYSKSDYSSERLWARSSDGFKILITLVYKNGLGKTDGSNPLLLSVNTGESSSDDPLKFNAAFISLLDRGFYIAKVYVRQENASDDYLQGIDFLLRQKITSKGLITGIGSGEGALLLGNVMNQHPEIFKVILLDKVEGKTGSPGFPYDNIKEQAYPAIMITALTDSGLQSSGPYKLAAKLRASNTGDRLLLIRSSKTGGTNDHSPFFCTFILNEYEVNK